MHCITRYGVGMSPELTQVGYEKSTYDDIADLDPLLLDEAVAQLPNLNAESNIEAIVAILNEATLTSQDTITSPAEALASLRDIDFLVSSLLRHGVNPLINIAGLEQEMIRLGDICQTVPRGTVFTYASINPRGERARSYTGKEEEAIFVEAVRQGVLALDEAIESIGEQRLQDNFGMRSALALSSNAMDTMTQSIVAVHRKISPEFFTNEMRPFFEPLKIGDREFTGSGGAQMQLLALDRVLWGKNDFNDEYQGFYEENYIYLTPVQREAMSSFLERNNQCTIVQWLETNPDGYDQMREEAIKLLTAIKKFRYPHRRVARDNFKIRSTGAVGSGSYTPDILDTLISKTEDAINRIQGQRHE